MTVAEVPSFDCFLVIVHSTQSQCISLINDRRQIFPYYLIYRKKIIQFIWISSLDYLILPATESFDYAYNYFCPFSQSPCNLWMSHNIIYFRATRPSDVIKRVCRRCRPVFQVFERSLQETLQPGTKYLPTDHSILSRKLQIQLEVSSLLLAYCDEVRFAINTMLGLLPLYNLE